MNRTNFTEPVLKIKLEDDSTPTGGISFWGETVGDFIADFAERGHPFMKVSELNKHLVECGIKPILYNFKCGSCIKCKAIDSGFYCSMKVSKTDFDEEVCIWHIAKNEEDATANQPDDKKRAGGSQMTNEEAIMRLKYDREMCYFNPSTGVAGEPYDEDCKEMAEALDIAIKALECYSNNDCVSRQATLDFIKDHSYPVRYDGNSIEQGMTLTGIEQALNEVPSIQPEQKMGRWIEAVNYCGEFLCTNCEQLCYTNKYRYCPNCGAKMESDEK